MNSIHDMGGMDGFGPVEAEENEPVFHDAWEGRVFALFAGGALGPWNRGRNYPWFRFALESIPPAEYLRMSYYERWYEVVSNNLRSAGLVSEGELETGYRDATRPLPTQLPDSGGGNPPPPNLLRASASTTMCMSATSIRAGIRAFHDTSAASAAPS